MKPIKKFLVQAMLILAFLIAAAALLTLAKAKINIYMAQVQVYASQIYAMKDIATTPEGLEQIGQAIGAVNPIVRKMSYLTYGAVPAALFLLWSSLAGASFYLSARKPKRLPSYLLSFAAISLIPFAVYCLTAVKILRGAGSMLMTGGGLYSIIGFALLLLFAGYITFISYTLIGKDKLARIPVHAIRLALRKMYPLLPVFTLLFAAAVALVAAATSSYMHIMSAKFGMSTAYNMLALAIALTITVSLKEALTKITSARSSL